MRKYGSSGIFAHNALQIALILDDIIEAALFAEMPVERAGGHTAAMAEVIVDDNDKAALAPCIRKTVYTTHYAPPCRAKSAKQPSGSPSGSYRRVKILLCAVLESNVNSDTFMQLNPFSL